MQGINCELSISRKSEWNKEQIVIGIKMNENRKIQKFTIEISPEEAKEKAAEKFDNIFSHAAGIRTVHIDSCKIIED